MELSFTAGIIQDMVINAPGSWHDSKVAVPIYHQLLDGMPNPWYMSQSAPTYTSSGDPMDPLMVPPITSVARDTMTNMPPPPPPMPHLPLSHTPMLPTPGQPPLTLATPLWLTAAQQRHLQ
jgi:hypothetical protein